MEKTLPQITAREITRDNWRQAARGLKLHSEQEKFVAPNWASIIEAHFEGCNTRVFYNGETMVGFAMYVYDPFKYEGHIIRLMVDKDQQGKGYGRAIMSWLMDYLKAMGDCEKVFISFVPENTGGRALYASLGFEDTGVIDDGEVVFCWTIPR